MRKILSAVVLAVTTSFSAPWALANRGGGEGYSGVRGSHVEQHYYHDDQGQRRGWYRPWHHDHHGHREYHQPAPRHYHGHHGYYP